MSWFDVGVLLKKYLLLLIGSTLLGLLAVVGIQAGLPDMEITVRNIAVNAAPLSEGSSWTPADTDAVIDGIVSYRKSRPVLDFGAETPQADAPQYDPREVKITLWKTPNKPLIDIVVTGSATTGIVPKVAAAAEKGLQVELLKALKQQSLQADVQSYETTAPRSRFTLESTALGAGIGLLLGIAVVAVLYLRKRTVLSEGMLAQITDLNVFTLADSKLLTTKLALQTGHQALTETPLLISALVPLKVEDLITAAACDNVLIEVQIGKTQVQRLRCILKDFQQSNITLAGIVLT